MKILTWNMRGYNGAGDKSTTLSTYLNSGEYDVICIQEVGTILGSFSYVKEIADHNLELYQYGHGEDRNVNHKHEYSALYYPFGLNNRCSMAIYVKRNLLKNVKVIPSYEATHRPMICACIDESLWVGNIHLVSGNTYDAQEQFDHFKTNMDSNTLPYYIVGDFNIDVQRIQANDGCFYHSSENSHTKTNLDYLYSYDDDLSMEINRLDPAGSDHCAVEFCIE